MKILPFLALSLALPYPFIAFSRESSKPPAGLHDQTPRAHALMHATVVIKPGSTVENATVILRDGLIEAVGTEVAIPADARIWDLSGKTVYPGFIDAYSHFGMPEGLKPFVRKPSSPGVPPAKKPPTPSEKGPVSWNPMVTPQRRAADHFKAKAKETERLSDIGFATVATFPGRGIYRGQGMVLNLNGKAINAAAIKLSAGQHIAFDVARGDRSRGIAAYPNSLMGSIALTRQALYDGQWRRDSLKAFAAHPNKLERPLENAALDALQPLLKGDQFALYASVDETDYERFGRIAAEFDLDYAILGNGYEYRKLTALKNLGATMIIPLAFPETPRVERPDQSLDYSLEQLEHWELAPSNPAFLENEGVDFCLTAHFLGDPTKEFWKSVREAMKRGLSEEAALAALSTRPAKLYGLEGRLGSIESGKIANLVVATGNLFSDKKAKVSAMWIDGDYKEKKPARELDVDGEWSFDWSGIDGFESGAIKLIDGKASLKIGDVEFAISLQGEEVLILAKPDLFGVDEGEGIIRLQAHASSEAMVGTGVRPDGSGFSWSAKRDAAGVADKEGGDAKKAKKEEMVPGLVFDKYPAGAYGVSSVESPESILVKNATIWTSGPEGRLEKTDLLIKSGKIVKIGRRMKAPKGAVVVNASGKHVTPGLIDCHSHAGISRGVNEVGSASTVEVRIGDVINPVDINLYRQLAGGLTTANLLHGSANPMGGQNQVIKLRWGEGSEGLRFQEAKPGVKFALGENVKQSNWGDRYTTRYPQTRMGVEQFMISQFRAAEDYDRRWNDYRSGKELAPPRRDLRSEATLEILRGERSIHIHSYRQDEILTFARLAGKLGLDVGAFQHILEGYKVADALAEIDAGGSSFADWWAYKFEVYDAIPYNGALMHEAGVVTSFNSDDAELATRLNTEAAKAVKYGGLSEEEALKFVTLNPAIQLRVDDRVGSLEVGKDADFVIWNEHPLSTYAYAEQTWIDGIKRFDREADRILRNRDESERLRLVQKALKARLKELKLGSKKKKPDQVSAGDEKEKSPEHEADWIYHDGTRHYSCSGLEEEAH